MRWDRDSITVLVPTRNRRPLLEAVLPSYLAQDPVSRVLVLDDASTDSTPDFLAEAAGADPRVRFLHNVSRRGLPANKNRGLEAAETRYVFIGEDDVRLPDGYLRALWDLMRARGAAVVGTPLVTAPFDGGEPGGAFPAGTLSWPHLQLGPEPRQLVAEQVHSVLHVHAVALLDMEAVDGERYCEQFAGNAFREESDLYLRLVARGGEVLLDRRRWFAHYRTRSALSRSGCREMGAREYEKWCAVNNWIFLARNWSLLRTRGVVGRSRLAAQAGFRARRAVVAATEAARRLKRRLRLLVPACLCAAWLGAASGCVLADVAQFSTGPGTLHVEATTAGGGAPADSSYDVFAIGPDNAVVQKTGIPGPAVDLENIDSGLWFICVDARDAAGSVVGGGQGSVMVAPGSSTSASVVLSNQATAGFTMDFADPRSFSLFPQSADFRSSGALRVEQSSAASTNALRALPPGFVAGRQVTVTATARAQGISQAGSSGGVTIALVTETAAGAAVWQKLSCPAGAFDWTQLSGTFSVPADTARATLVTGLQGTAGSVQVSRLGITEWWGNAEASSSTPVALPRLRGVMYGPTFNAEDLRVLGQVWGVNLIRWQLVWVPMAQSNDWAADAPAYDQWLAGALAECDKALDACESYRISVVVDLHTVPGGRTADFSNRMFSDDTYSRKFLDVWDAIARRYRGRRVVCAYDLANEPQEPAHPSVTWPRLATQAIDRIRAVDPGKPIVYETPFNTYFPSLPLAADQVIYSFHMYTPHEFTHQGIASYPVGVSYPGIIKGTAWNKERLRQEMQPARNFQLAYHLRMYVGEFSAVRWAPDGGAYAYLKDLTDIFEEYGWDWSYHAFREYQGWSVELGGDPQDLSPSPTPTDREQLLRGWFARDEKSQ